MTAPMPEQTMIERVADAIHEAMFARLAELGQKAPPISHVDYRLARAAIAAMREPTKAMLDASEAARLPLDVPRTDENWARAEWAAAIDSALSQSTTHTG